MSNLTDWLKRNRLLASILVLSVLFAFGIWIYLGSSRHDTAGILVASGRVEGDQAAVGAKVGGRITRLPIREGQTLNAGELIAEVSSAQALSELERAEHELHVAREEVHEAEAHITVLRRAVEVGQKAVELAEQESQARIGAAEAALAEARAHLGHVRAERERTEKDYLRYEELLEKELVAPQELDHAKAAFETAKATEEAAGKAIAQARENLRLARTTAVTIELRQQEVEQARDRLTEALAQLEVARARVQSVEAALKVARANLMDTRIAAPFEGTVQRKLVQEGEVVAAGTPIATLLDLTSLYVKVYLPERDIGKVRIGNPARVYVDAFPRRYFGAEVSEISQSAEFTPRDIHMKDERVKTVFALKLAIDNPEGFLKPGMPADARIRWDSESPWGDGLD